MATNEKLKKRIVDLEAEVRAQGETLVSFTALSGNAALRVLTDGPKGN